jgi:hypothetical protein
MNWIRLSLAVKEWLLQGPKRTLVGYSMLRWAPQRRLEQPAWEQPAWERPAVWEVQVSRV